MAANQFERGALRQYENEYPRVCHPEFFNGTGVRLNVEKAKRWRLPLPSEWLEGEFVELEISPLQETEIEPPPAHLQDVFYKLLESFGEKRESKPYFPYVRVQIKTRSHAGPDYIILSARDLLPYESRMFYGYSGHHFECHRTAFCYNIDTFANQTLDENEGVFDYIKRCFSRVKQGAQLQMGDHIFIELLLDESGLAMLKEGTENRRIMHSVIYIAPNMVFSKNGGGTSNPFYLQDAARIYEKYTNTKRFDRTGDIDAWRSE